MGSVEFGRFYKELTGSKSCPNDAKEKFRSLLGEERKKLPFEDLVRAAAAGELDFVTEDRDAMRLYIEANKSGLAESHQTLEEFDDCDDFSELEKCGFEKEFYSFYFSHPLARSRRTGKIIKDAKINGCFEGMVVGVQTKLTKNGKPFYVVTFEDEDSQIEVIFWDDQFNKCKLLLFDGAILRVHGVIPPPGNFTKFTLSKTPLIERIRMLDEISEEEETTRTLERGFEDMIKRLKEHAINEFGEPEEND